MRVIRSFGPWFVLLALLAGFIVLAWVTDDGCQASYESCTTYRESLDNH